MPKVVAIERTENHLRYVLADTGARGRLTIQAAESFTVDSDAESIPEKLGQRLKTSLTTHKATKARVIIGVGRGAVETVEFTVPQIEEPMLPDMVRSLAMRNLSSITEETPLDFLTSHPKEDGSRNVIAMTLREEVRRELDVLCQAAALTNTRILIRPHELRAFVAEDESANEVTLLVSCSPQMADVLLLHPQGSALSRSIRLPATSSPAKSAELAVNEIRRTLFSLPVDDFDATQIDQLLFLGGDNESPYLSTELGTALDARVQRRDPFESVNMASQVELAQRSQFAPLVGMLLNETRFTHPIDFLNPRKPPAQTDRRKAILGGVTAVALVIGGGWFYVNSMFAEVDDENAIKLARVKELRETAEKVEPRIALAKSLISWERNRISWLDELRDLTIRMPSSRELTVNRFSASASRDGGANVSFGGVAQSPEAVSQMENSLRDGHHHPRTPGLRERPGKDGPVWTFQTSMAVKARKAEEYTSHLPESPAEPIETSSEKNDASAEDSTSEDSNNKP